MFSIPANQNIQMKGDAFKKRLFLWTSAFTCSQAPQCWLKTVSVGRVITWNHSCLEETKPGTYLLNNSTRMSLKDTAQELFLIWVLASPVLSQVERPSFSIDSLRRHSADCEMDSLSAKGKGCNLSCAQKCYFCKSLNHVRLKVFVILSWQKEFSLSSCVFILWGRPLLEGSPLFNILV